MLQTRNSRFIDILFQQVQSSKILQPKTFGGSVIGKYLLLSYKARNYGLNTNIWLVSILQDISEDRGRAN